MAAKEVAMAEVQRNQPCPCGSGQKAKRCCHGPIQSVDVRVMLLEMSQEALDALAGTEKIEMRASGRSPTGSAQSTSAITTLIEHGRYPC
jgi:hypothetical protein